MRIVTQLEKHNAKQVQRALVEGKKEHDKPRPALHEAAQIAGEFIALKNSDGKGKIKLEDVMKHYRPKYLEKRGMI